MKPCRTHGETKRYASNGKCVACVAERGKARHAASIERFGNYHTGLKDGYVRLGTLAHRILVYVYETGPALHAELVEVMRGEVGLSGNLSRLVRHGFLHRAGRQRYRVGLRGGALYALDKPRVMVVDNTPTMSQARYRSGKRLKVASVFDFRGSIPL